MKDECEPSLVVDLFSCVTVKVSIVYNSKRNVINKY